jgi:hypothetical protein
VNQQLRDFFQSPSRETYLALRELIISSDAYDPYSDEVEAAGALCEYKKTEEARDAMQKAMGNLMLSPRAHYLLGFLHSKLGNDQAAQMECAIAQACIEGILSTGDGTPHNPFIVVRTSDEYDVLEHFGKEMKKQALSEAGDKHFDVIECKDGAEFWFDISDAIGQLRKRYPE